MVLRSFSACGHTTQPAGALDLFAVHGTMVQIAPPPHKVASPHPPPAMGGARGGEEPLSLWTHAAARGHA